MALFKEFKEFALKGNVVDLAIGVIIGAAFGKIIDSFVNDIVMPLLSLLGGGTDFTNKFITLGPGSYSTLEQAKAAGVATLNYGLFINATLHFLLIAFAIFIVVQQINKLRAKPDASPNTRDCPRCVSPIPITASRCKWCTADV